MTKRRDPWPRADTCECMTLRGVTCRNPTYGYLVGDQRWLCKMHYSIIEEQSAHVVKETIPLHVHPHLRMMLYHQPLPPSYPQWEAQLASISDALYRLERVEEEPLMARENSRSLRFEEPDGTTLVATVLPDRTTPFDIIVDMPHQAFASWANLSWTDAHTLYHWLGQHLVGSAANLDGFTNGE